MFRGRKPCAGFARTATGGEIVVFFPTRQLRADLLMFFLFPLTLPLPSQRFFCRKFLQNALWFERQCTQLLIEKGAFLQSCRQCCLLSTILPV